LESAEPVDFEPLDHLRISSGVEKLTAGRLKAELLTTDRQGRGMELSGGIKRLITGTCRVYES